MVKLQIESANTAYQSTRVVSGKFGHQVNSDTRLQTVGIQVSRLIRIFTVCLFNFFYQSPLILTESFQHNLINVSYLTACYLYQVMMTLHSLDDIANDAESTQTSKITS